ncbi:PilZ domain-containing protein [Alteraurantiacibacter buctensis]|uniref:PilZ domain-containing protein n=1 Tax=Alteraurantiacibacter buctensis TaxID=1503981 RepID=A0A844Z4I2_9SPHN|nr:hypothetical protein [Alteraurantiacibacter buctensis]
MHSRRHERLVVEYEVRCFLQDSEARLVIYDICVDGCCIDTEGFRVAMDEVIHFRFFDDLAVEGSVVWKNDRFAGVHFSQELHPALVLHLGFKPIAASLGEFLPRDRFGRELPPIGWMTIPR